MVGGPPLYLEAVIAQLRSHGAEVVAQSPESSDDILREHLSDVDAILMYCESEGDWERIEMHDGRPVVAVLAHFNIHDLIRALAADACPVHLGSSSELIVNTARAVAEGAALLPMGVARRLAVSARATEMPAGLDSVERKLVSALADGDSVARMAGELGYSDRTIRRRLQVLYVKLGVATRSEAIERSKIIQSGLLSGC